MENVIERLSKLTRDFKSDPWRFREEVKTLVKEGKNEIKQKKSQASKQSAKPQVMHTGDRCIEDKQSQVGQIAEVKVMQSVDQRPRMEDKKIQVPSEEIQESDKRALQVKEKQHSVSFLEEQLRICKDDLKAKEREIESLIERVARFSEMQTKRDQRNTEDTLSLNRPSIVERDFKNLKSEDREDALIVIRKQYNREMGVSPKRLSCIIFEAIYEHMLQTKSLMVDSFKEISKFAVHHGPWFERIFHQSRLQGKGNSTKIPISLSKGGSDYPREVLESFLLAAKESASELQVEYFAEDYFLGQIIVICRQKEVGEQSFTTIPWEQLLKDLREYVNMLTGLTWRMVTQVPPLRLEYQTPTFTSQYHQMVGCDHEGKAEKYGEKPVRYLWPGLVDGGGRVIALGDVTAP